MDERSPWDDRELLTETEVALRKILTSTEFSGEMLERIAQIIREDGDARSQQIQQLRGDVQNIRSMTNWIASIALMFGIAFIVKACS